MKKILATCLSFLLLASCTLTPKDTGRAYMFALPPVETAAHARSGDSLTVALPLTSPELDTYRIALTRNGGRWDYYAGARWADFLPLMVQDSLTKTLADAKLFKSVSTDQSGADGEEILSAEIRTFQAEYEDKAAAPTIKIRLTVHLKKRGSSFEIKTEAKAAKDSLPAIQAAFATAFGEAQRQVVYKLGRRS
jgi:cholesterol transport system auxiliary component